MLLSALNSSVRTSVDGTDMIDVAWSRYLPRDARLRDSGLCCVGGGEQRIQPGDVELGAGAAPERCLPCHAIIVVSRGSGEFSDRSGSYEIKAPAAIWLFPGVAHRYRPLDDGWDEHWVLFEGVATRAYESMGAWDRAVPVKPMMAPPDSTLLDCFTELQHLTRSPTGGAQLLAATVVHRIIGLVRCYTDAPSGQAPSIIEQVTRSFADDVSVSERARRLGVTAKSLRRQVRTGAGVGVHELIVRTRLARAEELLLNSDLPVAEISRAVGYDDPAYFSRLFRRRRGVSPAKFRDLPSAGPFRAR